MTFEVGVMPMSIMRSSKHWPGVPAPAQLPVLGRKSERVSGTPALPRAKTILRPGQTEIAGARPEGTAAMAEADGARLATGSV